MDNSLILMDGTASLAASEFMCLEHLSPVGAVLMIVGSLPQFLGEICDAVQGRDVSMLMY
jgi:hypothetical protein